MEIYQKHDIAKRRVGEWYKNEGKKLPKDYTKLQFTLDDIANKADFIVGDPLQEGRLICLTGLIKKLHIVHPADSRLPNRLIAPDSLIKKIRRYNQR